MNIQEALRDARTAENVSQEEIALRMGVRQQMISKWEIGAKQPTLRSLVAWASVLGMEVIVKEKNG